MIKRSGIRVTAAQLFNFLPVELRKITARPHPETRKPGRISSEEILKSEEKR